MARTFYPDSSTTHSGIANGLTLGIGEYDGSWDDAPHSSSVSASAIPKNGSAGVAWADVGDTEVHNSATWPTGNASAAVDVTSTTNMSTATVRGYRRQTNDALSGRYYGNAAVDISTTGIKTAILVAVSLNTGGDATDRLTFYNLYAQDGGHAEGAITVDDSDTYFYHADLVAPSTGESGTATVAGAGSVSAVARQQAGSSAAGAGSVTASGGVVITAGATVAGAGSVSATGLKIQYGNVSPITGSGAVTAKATLRPATASLSGTGAVTAAAKQTLRSTSTQTGVGSVSAVVRQVAGATVAGAGAVSATGLKIQYGSSSAAGVGAVTAAASLWIPGTATVAGAGAVTASATQTSYGTSTVAGAGSISATVVQQAAATVAGVGATTATAGQDSYGTATIVGQGSVTAAASLTIPGTSTVQGVGSVPTVNVSQGAGASTSGAGAVTADGSVPGEGTATVAGAGSVSAVVTQVVTATVAGVGAVTASGDVTSGTPTIADAQTADITMTVGDVSNWTDYIALPETAWHHWYAYNPTPDPKVVNLGTNGYGSFHAQAFDASTPTASGYAETAEVSVDADHAQDSYALAQSAWVEFQPSETTRTSVAIADAGTCVVQVLNGSYDTIVTNTGLETIRLSFDDGVAQQPADAEFEYFDSYKVYNDYGWASYDIWPWNPESPSRDRLEYDDTHVAHGQMAIYSPYRSLPYPNVPGAFIPWDSGQGYGSIWFDTGWWSPSSAVMSGYVYIEEYPEAHHTAAYSYWNIQRFFMMGNNGYLVSCGITAGGNFVVEHDGYARVWEPEQGFPLNQWIRIEMLWRQIDRTSAEWGYAYYAGDSLTPLSTYTEVLTTNGWEVVERFEIGNYYSNPTTTPIWFDSVQLVPHATSFGHPWSEVNALTAEVTVAADDAMHALPSTAEIGTTPYGDTADAWATEIVPVEEYNRVYTWANQPSGEVSPTAATAEVAAVANNGSPPKIVDAAAADVVAAASDISGTDITVGSQESVAAVDAFDAGQTVAEAQAISITTTVAPASPSISFQTSTAAGSVAGFDAVGGVAPIPATAGVVTAAFDVVPLTPTDATVTVTTAPYIVVAAFAPKVRLSAGVTVPTTPNVDIATYAPAVFSLTICDAETALVLAELEQLSPAWGTSVSQASVPTMSVWATPPKVKAKTRIRKYRPTLPTVEYEAGFNSPFRRYDRDHGSSLLVDGSTVTRKESPFQQQVAGADAAYIGGHEYSITAEEAAILQAAGYAITEIESEFEEVTA